MSELMQEVLLYLSIAGALFFLILAIFTMADFELFKMLGDINISDCSPFDSAKAYLVAEFLIASAIYVILTAVIVFLNRNKGRVVSTIPTFSEPSAKLVNTQIKEEVGIEVPTSNLIGTQQQGQPINQDVALDNENPLGMGEN